MSQKTKEPGSPVSKERAMEHGLLTIRRAWAGEIPDFEGWGGFELDPEPLVLHDLNGQVLFYEFEVMDGKEMVGAIKASASKIIGAAVPTVEFGPRGWDPDRAVCAAKEKVKERFPKAGVTETEFVCYSYPKIGVRVYIKDPTAERQSLILDVADLSFVERFGPDEPEGLTSWSFYQVVAEPNAAEREQRWELADKELEAARSTTPKIVAPGLTTRELPKLKEAFIPKPQEWQTYPEPIPIYSSQAIRFSPRCNTHECVELYAQKFVPGASVAVGQMILDFYRYYYTQDQIAAAMGAGPGGISNPDQVNGYESLSKNCLKAAYNNTANWGDARAEIDANRPLKSGVPGHDRACAGWKRQYIFISPQNIQIRRWMKIYDPWPWNTDICAGGNIYWEDWDAIPHTNFIYVRHRTNTCT